MITAVPPWDGTPGLELVDPTERRRFALHTPAAVTLTEVGPEDAGFRPPVDAAFSVTASSLTLPSVVPIHVRSADGTLLDTVEDRADRDYGPGGYLLELCAPIKVYVSVDADLRVAADTEEMYIQFGAETEVLVGARSKHDHPAATVTTTTAPGDLMRAVSTFSSGLKTTSPERSFPTLRGHPPLLTLGDELDIPAQAEPPDTGVRIEVPAEYGSIFVVAPLSYYLGAEVVPGSEPRIVTDRGFAHPLDTARGFEEETARVLKQTFFLDCLTRTEGLYPVELHERNAVESRVDLDFAALYDAPLAERLAAYLDVPFGPLEPELPGWKLTARIVPDATNAEMLPFVVDDLGIVYTPTGDQTPNAAEPPEAVTDFLRAGGAAPDPVSSQAGTFTRSGDKASESLADARMVQPTATDAMEQSWVGEGTPVGASEALPEAYQHRLERSPAAGDIDIVVVCNDSQMAEEEDIVDGVYGSRGDLPHNVTVHREVPTDEFRALLDTDAAFLHYIGHVDEDGFECPDGAVDADTLGNTAIDAFFLNACTSYEQGKSLIRAGAIGGVVTLRDVVNEGAVQIGRLLSELLTAGFPLRPALEIAQEEQPIGNQYLVIGDGSMTVTQPREVTPNLCRVRESGAEGYEMQFTTYAKRGEIGTLFTPYLPDKSEYYIVPGTSPWLDVSASALREFLDIAAVPVYFDGKLRWSDDILSEL